MSMTMKDTNPCRLLIIAISLLFFHSTVNAQIIIHTIEVKNTRDLAAFFKYTSARMPLISAHRGGTRTGFPENCIATLENTLQYTPAMFEIDPRLTKDSVVVLMHDATLDRTTTGKGKVSDYTWKELQQLQLKDSEGNVTPYRIPLLKDVLEWCKGKTILALDDKDVPYTMVAELVKKHNAFSNILMTVRNAQIAAQFYKLDNRFMFEAYVFDTQDVAEYESAGIPWSHVMAYVGPRDEPGNMTLYKQLNERGVKCMVSGARYIDKEYLQGQTNVYIDIFNHGADIIESDLPVQAARQVSMLAKRKGAISKYLGKKEIPLEEMKFRPF